MASTVLELNKNISYSDGCTFVSILRPIGDEQTATYGFHHG